MTSSLNLLFKHLYPQTGESATYAILPTVAAYNHLAASTSSTATYVSDDCIEPISCTTLPKTNAIPSLTEVDPILDTASTHRSLLSPCCLIPHKK